MTLIVPGYWQSTYWALDYWVQDYWLEYGAVAAPTPTAVGIIGKPAPRPKLPIHILTLIQIYLQNKIEEKEKTIN